MRHAVEDFCRRTNGVKLGVTVPEVAKEVITAMDEDGMSDQYLSQFRSILGLFSRSFREMIMEARGDEIDSWLWSKKLSQVTRNNRLTLLRVMFGFAKQRNYLPALEPTAPDLVPKVNKVKAVPRMDTTG